MMKDMGSRFGNGLGRSLLKAVVVVAFAAPVPAAFAQQGFFTRDDVIKYTPDWKGERFPDGRPKVSDSILDRMKAVTLEEAWAVLQGAGFMHQYEDGWVSIHGDQILVGRALTSVWMPGRPDIQKVIEETQTAENHRIGGADGKHGLEEYLQTHVVYMNSGEQD